MTVSDDAPFRPVPDGRVLVTPVPADPATAGTPRPLPTGASGWMCGGVGFDVTVSAPKSVSSGLPYSTHSPRNYWARAGV
jgi:hypothetical protein